MTYNFILVLDGGSNDFDAIAETIYEVGCSDSTLSFRDAVAYLDFDRDADSFEEAVLSAINQVNSIEGISVRRVEPDDLVTAAEIARRIDKTREYVRLLYEGKRGPGNFPAPLSGVDKRSLIWSWATVSAWLLPLELVSKDAVVQARTIQALNIALTLSRDSELNSEVEHLSALLGKQIS